jgi:hypothetical protein
MKVNEGFVKKLSAVARPSPFRFPRRERLAEGATRHATKVSSAAPMAKVDLTLRIPSEVQGVLADIHSTIKACLEERAFKASTGGNPR